MDGAVQNPAGRIVMVGTHKVDGRGKGTYLDVTQPDRVTVAVGVDGEGGFIDNGDNSATITIALTPSSRSNLVFSAMFDTGLAVPVTIFERNGRTAGACVRARFTKKAPIQWSDGVEVRTWVLVTTNWQGVVGDMQMMDAASIDESAL